MAVAGAATSGIYPLSLHDALPILPTDHESVASWLTGLRGSRVSLRVPSRGDKRALQETVTRNAVQAMARHKVARAGDLTARSQDRKSTRLNSSHSPSPYAVLGAKK